MTVRFEQTDEFLGYLSLTASSYRMVFLHKSDSGYVLVTPYYPSIVATPGVLPQPGTPAENASYQLEAVVKSTTAKSQDKYEALSGLRSMQIPASTQPLQDIMKSGSTDLRLLAVAALLEWNDISGLSLAEDALSQRLADGSRYLELNIAYAMRAGLKNPLAIPMLTRLIHAQEVETRQAAATALWRSGDLSAVPALAAALNDGDFEVRFFAVLGLAVITEQREWQPNMEVFQAEEEKYLQHWREWARINYPQH